MNTSSSPPMGTVLPYLDPVPTWRDEEDAHRAWQTEVDTADQAARAAASAVKATGLPNAELEQEAAGAKGSAMRSYAEYERIAKRRRTAAEEGQRLAEAGLAVEYFQAQLLSTRVHVTASAAPRSASKPRSAATRRTGNCGGRPAGRSARRSASSAGSSGDSDSSGSGPEPPPAPDVGRAGRLILAHILCSRRRRLHLRARLRRLMPRHWIGGVA